MRDGLRQARDNVAFAAAQVEVERAAVGVVKDEDRFLDCVSGCLHDGQRDFGQGAGSQPLLANEGGDLLGGSVNHRINLDYLTSVNLPG
jgi:hypothetical protein